MRRATAACDFVRMEWELSELDNTNHTRSKVTCAKLHLTKCTAPETRNHYTTHGKLDAKRELNVMVAKYINMIQHGETDAI